VLAGLSLTAVPDKIEIIRALEPFASTITERMAALENANRLGCAPTALFCPLLPGIVDDAALVSI